MNEDTQPIQSDQKADGLIGDAPHNKMWRRAVFFGVIGGMLMAALNLHYVESNNNGALRDFFRVVDVPLELLARELERQFGFGVLNDTGFGMFFVSVQLVGYWSVIGVFVASVYCLARNGVIKGFVRDKTCRRALFFGAIAGVLIGGLNTLVLINRWGSLQQYFDPLDRPVNLIMGALFERFRAVSSGGSWVEVVCYVGAIVVYWVIIAELVTSFICIFWIAGRRRETGEVLAAEE
jgi:hypothetical protein